MRNEKARALKMGGVEIVKDKRDAEGYRQSSIWFEHGHYMISESPSSVWEEPSGAQTYREAKREQKRRLAKTPEEMETN